MTDGPEVALGLCFTCKQPFAFDPVTVPSVPIDPVTGLPPDLGGDAGRARREPICPDCVQRVNVERQRRGLPLLREGRRGV